MRAPYREPESYQDAGDGFKRGFFFGLGFSLASLIVFGLAGFLAYSIEMQILRHQLAEVTRIFQSTARPHLPPVLPAPARPADETPPTQRVERYTPDFVRSGCEKLTGQRSGTQYDYCVQERSQDFTRPVQR